MPLRRRQRLLCLLALLGLLFQQVALAAYVCPHEQRDSAAMAQMPGCGATSQNDRARCEAHCHPLASSTDHAPPPSVPAALLPPTTWSRSAARIPAAIASVQRCEVSARATAPPATIRLCTFQI